MKVMTEEQAEFKRTDVGFIPADWELKRIGDFLEFKNGLNKAKKFFGEGTPIINYMDTFRFSGLKKEHIQGKVSLNKDEIRRFSVQKGDVFFTRTSETVEEIGISAVLEEDVENGVFSGFILRGRPTNKELCLKFKRYCFSSEVVRKQIVSSATYTTRALTNGRHLSKVYLPVPPTLAEQQAIATALSDVDELIRSLDALIEKKEAIKKGTMQQLLTGKKRLPGFEGEWEVRTLGDIADCLDNLRVPLNESQRKEMKGNIPYCGANGVLDYVDDYVIDDDIILIAEDGGYFDEYKTRPIAYRMNGKCWVNNHAHILKAKSHFDQSYLFYSLVHKNILDYIVGGTRAKLNKGNMIKIEILSPNNKEEQKAIAKILSDMDEDIEALRRKREKMARIKDGMMQELLTGKTRLVDHANRKAA